MNSTGKTKVSTNMLLILCMVTKMVDVCSVPNKAIINANGIVITMERPNVTRSRTQNIPNILHLDPKTRP